MFYLFDQNNSGGYFQVDDKVCHRLYIEADCEDEAIAKAEDLGCYWDGVSQGLDCPCCGDRWYDIPECLNDKLSFGDKHFQTIEEYAQHLSDKFGWTVPDARIYYQNGKVVEIYTKKRN